MTGTAGPFWRDQHDEDDNRESNQRVRKDTGIICHSLSFILFSIQGDVMDTIDIEFLQYAENLPEVICAWCHKEWQIGDVNNVKVLDAVSVVWQCPLCERWNGIVNEYIVGEMNALAREIVEG